MEKDSPVKKEILEKNAREYYNFGKETLIRGSFNSAVVLFFKAVVSLADLYILKETGKTPSSHNERFRIAQEKFDEIYEILDKDFPFYQDSYNSLMSKELAEVIKEDAEKIAGKIGFNL